MTNDRVRDLLDIAQTTNPQGPLAREVTDAQWADYGRMVHSRLMATDDLIITINRAGMRSKTIIEMVGYIRAFILTGTKP